MNDIFTNMIDVSVVVYLDDILLYSNDPKQHSAHVWEVLTRLWRNWCYAQADKCEFHCNLCEYLGYTYAVSQRPHNGPEQAQAIQD